MWVCENSAVTSTPSMKVRWDGHDTGTGLGGAGGILRKLLQ